MGLLDRQRQSIIDASNARNNTRSERFLRNERPRFRNLTETTDRSFSFRPEYGWAMNKEGLLAEQERKGEYDEAVNNYSDQISLARTQLGKSVANGEGTVNSAYDDAKNDINQRFSAAQSKNDKSYADALAKAGTISPELHKIQIGNDVYNVANVAEFNRGADVRETNPRYQNASSESGRRGDSDAQDLRRGDTAQQTSAITYNRSWAQSYVQSQNSQIQQARDANIAALRKQAATSKSNLQQQKTTALSNLSKEKSTALSNYNNQAAAKVAGFEETWNTSLNKLKGMYAESVAEGAEKYQSMKDRYNNSITGLDEGLLGGATTGVSDEDLNKWGFNAAEIKNQDLITLMEDAEKNNDTELMNYLQQIALSRTESENAEETV